MKTEVIYRVFEGELIAIFPTIASGTHAKYCLSYQTIGQHGGCVPGWLMQNSSAVTVKQASELRELSRELKDIGYDLIRVYNVCREYNLIRKQQLIDMGL